MGFCHGAFDAAYIDIDRYLVFHSLCNPSIMVCACRGQVFASVATAYPVPKPQQRKIDSGLSDHHERRTTVSSLISLLASAALFVSTQR